MKHTEERRKLGRPLVGNSLLLPGEFLIDTDGIPLWRIAITIAGIYAIIGDGFSWLIDRG